MSTPNMNEIANSLYQGPVLHVVFYNKGERGAIPSPDQKTYRYKCPFPVDGLKPGDQVLVDNNDMIRSVTIAKIGDEEDLEDVMGLDIKWAIAPCQFPLYDDAVAREKEVISQISKQRRANMRAQALAAVGISKEDFPALLGGGVTSSAGRENAPFISDDAEDNLA